MKMKSKSDTLIKRLDTFNDIFGLIVYTQLLTAC